MATNLAKAWRQRSLLLPFSFLAGNDSTCPAFDVCSLALGGMVGFPSDHFGRDRKISTKDLPNLCYYCKNQNVQGFLATCSACSAQFDKLPEATKFNYLFHIYPNTLLFASIKWN